MAIQPKNTADIKVNTIAAKSGSTITLENQTLCDDIREDTAAAGVSLNNILKFASALLPLAATIDFGSSTAAEHIRELFVKEITSNGQALAAGTDSAHDLSFKTNALTRASFDSSGNLENDATNGGDLDWSAKSGTYVAFTLSSSLTALGSSITDALDLVSTFNLFTTVAASTGAQLPDSRTNSVIFGLNAGANALLLYPHSGAGTHNGGAGGAAVSIAAGSAFICWRVSATNWISREFALAAA